MVTKNMKSIVGEILQTQSSAARGHLPVKTIEGLTYYCGPGSSSSFPASVTTTLSLSETTAGISVGTGGTPAAEDDYQLEATITSGIVMTLTSTSAGCDEFENPYVTYQITVTNNKAEPVTIREIGYKQNVRSGRLPNTSSSYLANYLCLIDRTVLDEPVTIQPGDAGIVAYTLKTVVQAPRYISGVKIVSWTWGSDEDIAAMLDAAKQGVIDLQEDAGWRVGDVRRVSISAFVGGNNKNFAAQTVPLVISSFAEYEGCGNVMQFDFCDCLAEGARMKASSGGNVGGYNSTEMRLTTLPALANAFPSWLSERLATFNVKTSEGGQSATIITSSDNKLALRSEAEVFGTAGYSAEGEGTQVDLYKTPGYRNKLASGNARQWWLRSPYKTNSTDFLYVSGAGTIDHVGPHSTSTHVSPFGCI